MLRRNPKKSKKENIPTCGVCGLWDQFCVCEILPRKTSRIEFLLIQHSSELLRQSNTGRLVEKMIEPCEIIPWGSPDVPFSPESLKKPGTRYLVLYPRSDTRLLEPADLQSPGGGKTSLVLLDATWAQAKSMSRRIGELQDFPFVSLPQGEAPRWKLRRSPGPGYCCTLEAVIRTLAIIEGADFAAPLELALELVMTHSLHMRGKLNKTEMEDICLPIIEGLRSL